MSTVAAASVMHMPLDREFEELFRKHSRLLYRTAYSLLDNAADAEDVLQTIFLRLLRNGLPPDFQKNVKGYLYRAAVNVSLDTIRSRKRRDWPNDLAAVEALAAVPDSAPSDSIEERHQRLAEALTGLDPETAQILVLKYVHGYKDADIAKVIGTSRGAIAMRLLRSRSRLKKLMRDLSGESK
jgi:RNA polymerase sigma-70 factor, ECF subfamily